ncbi:acyl-ACP--UDP-N-acetylglucosamine O-acyltransferase [Acuticoccus sp. M5D2P5]|uniref:acyl-ACP--UDP-N-acetylglucosamine O-acyltransferase n=1 Tax=Acuticoccus kalidii TaxID=2910977 RepID=UPI001F2890E1|nr:acyl-ACP--UDP-N-acetylglucosamine O-acyltransferase [Acuticoccus kalidii]
MTIHPTAIVAEGAQIGEGVTLGPYTVIDGDVTLGDRVTIGPHCVVTGHTTIGADTRLFPGTMVGGPPQDLSYNGERTEVVIGARTVLREHVTVHAGTQRGRARTVVGDDCFLMAGAHVGHDCVVGNHVILSNNVLLAGHASLGDYVLIGGGAAIVQRVRIGAYAFISGLSGVTKDVIPYAYVIGHRGRLDSLNLVGLKRRGFGRQDIRTLLDAYAMLFEGEGLFRERLARLTEAMGEDPLVARIVDFIAEGHNRPLLHPLPKSDTDAQSEIDLLEAGV